MNTRTLMVPLVASLSFAACSGGDGAPSGASAVLESDGQKASYAMGLDIGTNLKPAENHLDMAALLKGIEDALAEAEPAISQEELYAVMQSFSQTIREEQQAAEAAEGAENDAAGAAYMAENATREGVITTESGLQYEVLTEGTGDTPVSGDEVSIHYAGSLTDGTEFDASDRAGQPLRLGVDAFVSGFSEGLKLMKVGETARFVIPGNLAYGPQRRSDLIGPNQTLVFEVELLEVHRP